MRNPPIVKIADFAEQLSRLRLEAKEGRPITRDEIEQAFNDACHAAFGYAASAYNVDEDEISGDLLTWYNGVVDTQDEAAAEAFANRYGFSLKTYTGALLDDWEQFLFLVVAKAAGLFHA